VLGSWIETTCTFVTGTRQREDLPNGMQMTVAEDGSDAVLAGFESPLRAGRSVVAVVTNPASQPSLLNALMTPELLQAHPGQHRHRARRAGHSVLAGDSYYVGRLPPMAWLQWNLSRSPLLLAGLVVALALLGAAVAFASLQLAHGAACVESAARHATRRITAIHRDAHRTPHRQAAAARRGRRCPAHRARPSLRSAAACHPASDWASSPRATSSATAA
jgi:hypothetical protein